MRSMLEKAILEDLRSPETRRNLVMAAPAYAPGGSHAPCVLGRKFAVTVGCQHRTVVFRVIYGSNGGVRYESITSSLMPEELERVKEAAQERYRDLEEQERDTA